MKLRHKILRYKILNKTNIFGKFIFFFLNIIKWNLCKSYSYKYNTFFYLTYIVHTSKARARSEALLMNLLTFQTKRILLPSLYSARSSFFRFITPLRGHCIYQDLRLIEWLTLQLIQGIDFIAICIMESWEKRVKTFTLVNNTVEE